MKGGMADPMIEEEIMEIEQEVFGLSTMEKEAKALEEADAKAVEQAREKRRIRKRKARRRKLLITLFIILAVSSGIGIYLYRKKQKEAAAKNIVEITAEEGQQIIYARITQIQGNEIDYTETDPEMPGHPSGQQTGQSKTAQIPVGTEVTTMLGAVTTFSRLSAGDTIAMVMEDDDIVHIYMIG